MSETEVTVETPEESTTELAEAIADAQLEVAHTLEEEAQLDAAQETAESALEIAVQSAPMSHEHMEYALTDHSHFEFSEHSERLSDIENRITAIESSMEVLEEPEVEEIEPIEEPPPSEPEAPRRKHRFGSRR